MNETSGGRPRQIERADIVAVGRAIGLRELSLDAVASQLGVTATALYRHVPSGRAGLEQLVGESLLSDLRLADDPTEGTQTYLLRLGLCLYDYTLEHPGLPSYVQLLFPRGHGGRRLMADAIAALGHRGYPPDVAVVLSSSVASYAIGQAVAQEQRPSGHLGETERQAAWDGIADDTTLAAAHHSIPHLDHRTFLRLTLTAVIGGLVEAAPLGRSLSDIIHDLDQRGGQA